jgi:hypothetical protein
VYKTASEIADRVLAKLAEEERSPFESAAALYDRLLSEETSLRDRLIAEGKKMHGTKVAPGITSVQTLADRGSGMWGDLKRGLEVARGRGPEDLGQGGVIYPGEGR